MRENYINLCTFNFGKRCYVVMRNDVVKYFELINGNYELPIVSFKLYDNEGKSLTYVNQHFFMSQLVNIVNNACKKGFLVNNDEISNYLRDICVKTQSDSHFRDIIKGTYMKKIDEDDFEENKKRIIDYLSDFEIKTYIDYSNVSIFNGDIDKNKLSNTADSIIGQFDFSVNKFDTNNDLLNNISVDSDNTEYLDSNLSTVTNSDFYDSVVNNSDSVDSSDVESVDILVDDGSEVSNTNEVSNAQSVNLDSGIFTNDGSNNVSNTNEVSNVQGVNLDSDIFTIDGSNNVSNTNEVSNAQGVNLDSGIFTNNGSQVSNTNEVSNAQGVNLDSDILVDDGSQVSNTNEVSNAQGVNLDSDILVDDGSGVSNTNEVSNAQGVNLDSGILVDDGSQVSNTNEINNVQGVSLDSDILTNDGSNKVSNISDVSNVTKMDLNSQNTNFINPFDNSSFGQVNSDSSYIKEVQNRIMNNSPQFNSISNSEVVPQTSFSVNSIDSNTVFENNIINDKDDLRALEDLTVNMPAVHVDDDVNKKKNGKTFWIIMFVIILVLVVSLGAFFLFFVK